MITIIISVLVLTVLEVVLGIDNIIFIGILSSHIENKKKAERARRIGLVIALGIRIIALLFISYLAHMTDPLFSVSTMSGLSHAVSFRDIILFLGGLFLIHKSVSEIHGLFDSKEHEAQKSSTMFKVIVQIVIIDLIFSIDSILTAIGLVEQVEIMITAVILSMTMMFFLSGKISDFIESRPSLKVLALSFLIMIGATLVMEGSGLHIDKSYIYFAMSFAAVIEFLNSKIKMRPDAKQLKKAAKKLETENKELVLELEK